MLMSHCFRFGSRLPWLGAFVVLGCGSAPPAYVPGQTVMCDNQPRTLVDCSAHANLRHDVVKANAGIKQLGFDVGGGYESAALGQVRESTEQLALQLESACRDYNACVTDANTYLQVKDQVSARLSKHLNLVAEQQTHPSAALGDAIWSNAVPDQAEQRLVLRYNVQSRQAGRFVAHASGDALTSGTELRVDIEVNRDAYVYLVLVTPHDNPMALYPNPDLRTQNPLRGTQRVSLPPSGVSLILDQHPGVEHLQFIASVNPLPRLEASLEALRVQPRAANTGDTTKLKFLQDVGALICKPKRNTAPHVAGTRVDCDDTPGRGLLLVRTDAETDQQVAATPNDDVVVLQHEITHR